MADSKDKKPDDPTEDEQFKHVVEHFLKTPPKPHKEKGADKAKPRRRPVISNQDLENGGDAE